jgi:site-specific DNA-cytosine methylase
MKLDFTAFFPFSGLGAGARGFLDAEVSLLGRTARFRSLGGIDVSEEACQDFEMLTGSPALCADVSELEPSDLLRLVGPTAPDVVFGSPPCKGFSGLLSIKAAKQEKYQVLNELVPKWFDLILKAWPDEPPRLILLENVPRIVSRGKALLDRVKRQLGQAGYLLDERTHDCGELGGLAQHRRRYLLVARHPRRCPPLLFQPPKLRVRGCGEVLGQLPLPGDPAAGPMHTLPRITWINWVRLALIPAGGDWRDLPGVLAEGQARREVHKRYEVARWENAMGTICGSHGSNAASYVADPRVVPWHRGVLGVRPWDKPSWTITGGAAVSRGSFSVADPRPPSQWRGHTMGVVGWATPIGAITGRTQSTNGRFSVADPRVASAGCYPRVSGKPTAHDFTRLLSAWDGDPKKAPPFVPVIIAADGTWHRPMSTLELAALQGLPVELAGKPLELAGGAVSRWRERIGNAVPVQTATAIARQMLVALTEASLGCDSLGLEPVWVNPEQTANVEIS